MCGHVAAIYHLLACETVTAHINRGDIQSANAFVSALKYSPIGHLNGHLKRGQDCEQQRQQYEI